MTQATDKLFDEISRFVSDSRELLDKGAVMELAGLDDHIKSLCEQVLQLKEPDRAAYAKKLEQLFAELTDLGDRLVKARDSVNDQLQQVTTHKKAMDAYRTADSRDKKKKD